MSEAKHTPGPWKCDENGVVTGGPDYCTSVCETYRRRWAVPEGLGAFVDQIARDELVVQNEVNGRLIAAAPELLEACRDCAEWYDVIKQAYPEMLSLIRGLENARAAIAKAEGRTNE